MIKPMIEFCTNNMHHGTEKVVEKLEQDDQYDIIEYGCLGNCDECYMVPFAIVEGTIVATESVDELYERIVAEVKQHQSDREAYDKILENL